MGGYHLSLQETYPSRLDGANSSKSRRGSRSLLLGKKAMSKKVASHESPDYYFPNKSESCKPNSDSAPEFYPSPPRHSTACCDGLAERREIVKRFQLHKIHGGEVAFAGDCNGGSFRSEDSESLALWEEKEKEQQSGKVSMPGEIRWMNPWRESVTQAVKKLETAVVSGKDRLMPWKSSSSPVHPKTMSSFSESAKLSLDRKGGSRSPWRDLMGSRKEESTLSKSWYQGSSRKNQSGELSPSNLSQTVSGEIVVFPSKRADQLEAKPDLEPLPKDEVREEEEAKISSLEISSDPHSIAVEDTRSSPSAVACDVALKLDESPVSDLPAEQEKLSCGNAVEEISLESSVALKVEEKQPEVVKKNCSPLLEPFVGRLRSMKKSYSMDDIFRSCQSASDVDVELSMSPRPDVKQNGNLRFHRQESSKVKDSPVIDLVAPSAAKFLDLDKQSTNDSSPAPSPIKNAGTVPFNWEEVPGKPKAIFTDTTTTSGEVSCCNLQLPPYLAVSPRQQRQSSQESLRIHYIKKAMSAPLAGFYQTLPAKFSSPCGGQDSPSALKSKILPASWLRSPAAQDETDSTLVRSISVGELKKAFGTFCSTVGRSDLEATTDSTDYNNTSAAIPISMKGSLSKDDHATKPSSPTSILCGPDYGSVSSDSGLNGAGAPPTPATSSSSSSDDVDAPYDNLDEREDEDVEVTSPYRLTPAAVMIPSLAEAHRISLSFRDFGPSRDQAAVREDTHEGVQPLMSFLENNRWFKHPAQSLPIFDAKFHHSDQFAELSDECEEAGAPSNKNNKNMFMDDCTFNTEETKMESPSAAVSFCSLLTDERKEAATSLDFTARLGGRFSPLRIFSNSEESSNGGSCERGLSAAVFSLPRDEESGNRSPAYTATLELFSPAVNSKNKKKRRSILPRHKAHSSRRSSARVHVRARFLVSLTKSFSVIAPSAHFCCFLEMYTYQRRSTRFLSIISFRTLSINNV